MSADPNKKSARTFQCRDVLWDTFDQMARELECSVDYLINEAMKQYARQRNARGTMSGQSREGRDAMGMPSSDPRFNVGGSAPPPGMQTGRSSGVSASPMAPPPQMQSPMSSGRLPPPPARGGGLPVPPPPRTGGGPTPMGVPMPPPRSHGGMGHMG